MASPKKTWYVEAVGPTNELIATELPAENASRGIICQDGKLRDFWVCDYRFITKLLKCEEVFDLKFNVFYRERPLAPVKPWPFLRKRRMTAVKALQDGLIKRANALLPASSR
jgi:hypothetical protein